MYDFAERLKEAGLKATIQRIFILEVIESYGHATIEEIYEETIKKHPSLSLATVYKNILLMVEKGVLNEVPVTGKKTKYELSKEDHIHLICTSCGKVEDRPYLEDAQQLFSSLSRSEHFALRQQLINLYGLCHACQSA